MKYRWTEQNTYSTSLQGTSTHARGLYAWGADRIQCMYISKSYLSKPQSHSAKLSRMWVCLASIPSRRTTVSILTSSCREGCDRRNICDVSLCLKSKPCMGFNALWCDRVYSFQTFVDVDSIQSVHHMCHTLYLYCTRTRHVQKQVVKQKRLRGLFHCCAASRRTQDSHKTGARIMLKSTSSQQHNVTCI